MDFFKRYVWGVCSFAVAAVLVGGYTLLFAPPLDFPSGDTVVISRGASASDISEQLYDANIIKHASVLSLILRISGASSRVKSGAYLFKTPENVFTVARRLSTGAYGLPPVSITFPEGVTVRDIAEKVSGALPLITSGEIISLGKSQEGYLFPDTYFFPPDATAQSVINAMRKNFDAKTASLSGDIQTSGYSLPDIITMASLVEKEARTVENRRIVAGILWDRLDIGMPLQVDAVFGYIFNRDTYSPSFSDLKTESPYNLYLHTGLPPGPIANPGIESIQAALHPTKTDYLYYLTGSDNLMHYATTYIEHQSNQRKYLK
ncbi:MAG: endolytic transglycosylase MltG [Candidatus Taylorbacteria bacterium]|nr:endolytic transglycosylase MltG [Candidatus Taylorbacteria bacterium]